MVETRKERVSSSRAARAPGLADELGDSDDDGVDTQRGAAFVDDSKGDEKAPICAHATPTYSPMQKYLQFLEDVVQLKPE